MRDFRLPLTVALPAAIAVVALIWILRKKSGKKDKPGDKPSVLHKKDRVTVVEEITENSRQVVEKEGITITQRKIPEIQARDRGAADLNNAAPDMAAGTKPLTSPASDSVTIPREGIDCIHVSDMGDGALSVTLPTEDTNLTAVQLEQVEKIIVSAMGDGIHEATSKLLGVQIPDSMPSEGFSSLSPSGAEGIEESFAKISTIVASVPPEKVVTCSSVAKVGFDVAEEAVLPEAKTPVMSESTRVPQDECGKFSESAAEGESQNSPKQQAAMFPSTDTDSSCACPVLTTSISSWKPSNLGKEVNFEEATTLNVIKDSLNTSLSLNTNNSSSLTDLQGSSSAKGEVSKTVNSNFHRSGKDENLIRQTQIVSQTICQVESPPKPSVLTKSRLESQGSLGPEDIDNLWGIKPTSRATENWDKQLSLDDPSSPLTRMPPATVEPPSTIVSSSVSKPGSSFQPQRNSTNNLESPDKPNSPLCDNNSEGSNDSGRGGSEHDPVALGSSEALVQFDFNMPSDLCGRFIGRQGKNINFLKSKTGANISLSNNPFSAEYQVCHVAGTQSEVDSALTMIRRKFPQQDYPLLTMVPINVSPFGSLVSDSQHPVIVPDIMQLSLPEGVSVEVYVSAIVDAGHVFVQQPTHRSFMSLEKLTYSLNQIYGEDCNVPAVPKPIECGVICVVESDGYWYRAMIMSQEDENGEAQIKFVDYGGYANMPVSALKQIRTDFMTLPFQAVECFMANITPLQGDDYFNDEATNALSEMTNYKLLHCQVVARSETGTPYIHLYQISPDMNSAVLINRALVNNQQARWVEIV